MISSLNYDDAELMIAESIQRVKNTEPPVDVEDEIDWLMMIPVVDKYFTKEELRLVFQFELQDERMFTNIITKEIQ
tara:strand:+ start:4038 stop:4265 length:228 start_codon:yes stop_codon:yes gene_type:complete